MLHFVHLQHDTGRCQHPWPKRMTDVIHLREVALLPPGPGQPDVERYPFAVPAVAALGEAPLRFDAPVTFLVGENGSGKSAILEGVACAVGSVAIAGDDPRQDPTLAAARALGQRLRLTWSTKTRRGYFLRAEDFFGFAKYISALRAGLEQDLAALNAESGPGDVRQAPGARGFSARDRIAAADRHDAQRDLARGEFPGVVPAAVHPAGTVPPGRAGSALSRRCGNWRCWRCSWR